MAMLVAVLARAMNLGKRVSEVQVLRGVYDFALELVRTSVPGFPVVTSQESSVQIRALKDNWIPWLNQRFGREVWVDDRTSTKDVSADRALDGRYERRNQGPHEATEGSAVELDLASFTSAHRLERLGDVFRLVMVTTLPIDVPAELLLDSDVGLMSVPLWMGSASEASPLVRFQPILTSSAPLPEFLEASVDLAEAGCVWYSHLTLVREIRRQALNLCGLVVEKCDSPRLLLTVANQPETKHPSFARFGFGAENVLVVVAENTFSFALASDYQVQAFIAEAGKRRLRRYRGRSLRAGPHWIGSDVLARAALWGFVGG
jgi:hypothetical protein